MKTIFNVLKFFWLYVGNILVSIDQLANVLMFGAPDETISSRAGRRWPNSVWAKFIDLLFFAQKIKTGKRHVIASIEPKDRTKHDLISEDMTEAKFVKILVCLFFIFILSLIIYDYVK